MQLSSTEAEQLALEFLIEDLEIPAEEQEYFAVLGSRETGADWFDVEIGIEGLPDKWVIQVYDTRECDPCYTFVSPVSAAEEDLDLADFPENLATVVATERKGSRI